MKIVGREETPNPAALKFIMDGPVVARGTLSISAGGEDEEYTGDNSLAKALFKLGASEIYLCNNYVSVTMYTAKAWDFFMGDVTAAIETHMTPPSEEALKKEPKESVLDKIDRETFPNLTDKEKTSIIDSLMDEIIRPALANDGGGLELLKVEGNEVQIKYQGACGSCPSSTGGTLAAIQRALQSYLDPGLVVSIRSS